MDTMKAVYLPGDRSVDIRDVPVPEPGWGQVLLAMQASSICGSDIRAIYREHLGTGPEAYQNVIAGHEPSGKVLKVGPGCKRFKRDDRVLVYHISGCGVCDECKAGYMISCASEHRAAYGWQRDGGHAAYMVAEENTLILLPDFLTYTDGALCACGFGTTWEALTRMRVSGADKLLITGLGPVGLSAAMLGKMLGVSKVVGLDVSDSRLQIARDIGLVDDVIDLQSVAKASSAVLAATNGKGCEAAIDCSGAPAARRFALAHTRAWGRCAFVGEGNNVDFPVSELLIHKQITLFGSWVTSLDHLSRLVEALSTHQVHPERIVTHRFSLEEAPEAYRLMDEGKCGKVVICFNQELARRDSR